MSLSASFFEQIGGGGLSGEEQDLASGEELANANCRLNPVHVRHDDVADDKLRSGFFCPIHCGGPRINRRGIEAVLVEDDGKRIRDNAFIIDDENTRLAGLAVR